MYSAAEAPGNSREASLNRIGYTRACDVYSLGAMLYVILSGQFPFMPGDPHLTHKKRRED